MRTVNGIEVSDGSDIGLVAKYADLKAEADAAEDALGEAHKRRNATKQAMQIAWQAVQNFNVAEGAYVLDNNRVVVVRRFHDYPEVLPMVTV
jgi:hypothetical protein